MPLPHEYVLLLEQAKRNSKENKAFLNKLRKNPPPDLDYVTNHYHNEAFERIDCLNCANCCTTTGPLLKNRDITALAKHFRMRESQFLEKYLRIDEDQDYVFKSMPCPFLNGDNYCSVYENRPGACRDYPHTQQRNIVQKLPITFQNSMICPAVSIVVEQLKTKYQKPSLK